jgi:nucleoside phosphorylase
VTLIGKFVLLAGSASPEAAPESLSQTITLVRAIVGAIVRAGGGVVVFTGAPEPTSSTGTPLIFDWVALEEVERLRPAPLAAVAVTSKKLRSRMSPAQSALLDRLSANGTARLLMIPDNIHTGGNIVDSQVAESSAMIAIGGGRGVFDRATRMMRKGAIVLPLDAHIGSTTMDGKGSEELYQQALAEPVRFVPSAPDALRDALPALNVHAAPPETVANAALNVLSRAFAAQDAARRVDVLVLTALPVELEAMKHALNVSGVPHKTSDGTNVWKVDVSPRTPGRSLRVAVACLGSAGNVSAAAITASLTTEFRPRLIVMVGIAAGIRGKCRIGDVVFSERVTAYEPAAIVALSGFWRWLGETLGVGTSRHEPRPEMYRLSHAIEQDVVTYLARIDAVAARLASALAAHGVPSTTTSGARLEVRPRLAGIASGEKLLRDPTILAGLREEMHGRIEIGEMEAVGIAEACRRRKTDFLIIRGVSDFGDTKKTDDGHRIASAGAAFACADFLREGLALTADDGQRLG